MQPPKMQPPKMQPPKMQPPKMQPPKMQPPMMHTTDEDNSTKPTDDEQRPVRKLKPALQDEAAFRMYYRHKQVFARITATNLSRENMSSAANNGPNHHDDQRGSGGSSSGEQQTDASNDKPKNEANTGEKRLTDEQVRQLTDSANAAKTKRGRPTS
ncbi:hypothetical protein TI39_contig4226g00002 [Zymoseptoria brevis]|uniref:Uncharacterized protein n=1 Tax=Zymoseptoria brevis TaxID=1047168 RepID=A0A0F4G9L1_9PEZI|nr:hypothetical protein TI39_contig4226g00002 [Zymoseptoria brevis]